MDQSTIQQCIAFAGTRRLLAGTITDVALAAKRAIDHGENGFVQIFDDETGRVVDLDLRGSDAEIIARLGGNPADASPYREGEAANSLTLRGRGRPKLGVVAREVTLLPRHWDWLATQPGGASAAVRRLVDEARSTNADKDRMRVAKESAYRFMSAMAGDEAGFEEATRALFANDARRFTEMSEAWPHDVRDHARALAKRAIPE